MVNWFYLHSFMSTEQDMRALHEALFKLPFSTQLVYSRGFHQVRIKVEKALKIIKISIRTN